LFGSEPVDPDPASLPSAPAPASPTAATARHEPATAAAHAAKRTDAPSAYRVTLDAALALALGHHPGPGAGGALHVALEPRALWQIALSLLALAPSTAESDAAEGRARFELLMAGLSLCPFEPLPSAAVWVCAGAEAGRLRVVTEGFASGDGARNDLTANLLGRLLFAPELSRALRLHLGMVLIVPLVQRSYVVERANGLAAPLYRMPQVAARLELGLGLIL
jgi:hypothetical protein